MHGSRKACVFLAWFLFASLIVLVPLPSFVPSIEAAAPFLPVSGDAWTENDNATYVWTVQPTTKDSISFSTEKVHEGSYALKVNHTYAATQMAFSLDIGASTDFSGYAFMSMWAYFVRPTVPSTFYVDWRTTGRFSGNKYEVQALLDLNRWQKFVLPLDAWLNSTSPTWTNRRYLCIQLTGLTNSDYSVLYIDGIRFETSIDYYSESNSVDETILPNLWAFVKNNQKVATYLATNYQSTYTYTALNGTHSYETLESEALGFTIYALLLAYNASGHSFLLDEAKEYAEWLVKFQHATKKGFSQYYNNATGLFNNIADATYDGWILAGLSFLYHFWDDATLKTVLDDAVNFWATTMWDASNKWFDASYNMATSTKTEETSWTDMKQGSMMNGMWSYYHWVEQNSTILSTMNTHSNQAYSQITYNRYAFKQSLGEETIYLNYGFFSAYKATSNSTYLERLLRLRSLVFTNNMLSQNGTFYQKQLLSDYKGTHGFEGWGWSIMLPLLLELYRMEQNANLLNYVEMSLWDLFPQIKTVDYALTRYRGSTSDMATQQQVVGQNAFMIAAMAIYYDLIYQPTNPYLISSTKNITATAYSSNQLSFTVSASTGQTSTTKVFCGDLQKPKSVSGLTSIGTWSYDDSTKILTVTDTHSSSLTFTVAWSGSASGKYSLTVQVLSNHLPTSAIVQILNQNQTTNLLGQTRWLLPYGTYDVEAYCGGEKQSMTVMLNEDKTVGFNFVVYPKPLNFTPVVLVLVVVVAGLMLFLLFQRRH